jgi:hypothetical protein
MRSARLVCSLPTFTGKVLAWPGSAPFLAASLRAALGQTAGCRSRRSSATWMRVSPEARAYAHAPMAGWDFSAGRAGGNRVVLM